MEEYDEIGADDGGSIDRFDGLWKGVRVRVRVRVRKRGEPAKMKMKSDDVVVKRERR